MENGYGKQNRQTMLAQIKAKLNPDEIAFLEAIL